MMPDCKVYVVKNESNKTGKLQAAFQLCLESNFTVSWIDTAEVFDLLTLNKKDVFIIDPFSGDAFEYLRDVMAGKHEGLKCVVLGPRCMLYCIRKCASIPNYPYPAYTAAMGGIIVTSSGVKQPNKNELIDRVKQMGGYYCYDLNSAVTHVVAVKTLSPKYQVCARNAIPVLTPEWIDECWARSCVEDIHALDDDIYNKYKCPVFNGLTICCSQFSKVEKTRLKACISCNGGIYSGDLSKDQTDVLVLASSVGDKFKFARDWGIPCVTDEWIYQSADQSYLLDIHRFGIVNKDRASTPVRDVQHRDPNWNNVSVIRNNEIEQISRINETLDSSDILNSRNKSLDVERARRAGPFLKGCKVYIHGYGDIEREKLSRIVSYGNGNIAASSNEPFTHLLCSSPQKLSANKLPYNCYVVGEEWLKESIKLKHPVDPLQLGGVKIQEEEMSMDSCDTESGLLFSGVCICVLPECEDEVEIMEEMKKYGVITAERRVDARYDYVVVPMDYIKSSATPDALHYVTSLWVEDCISKCSLVDVCYYHEPYPTPLNRGILNGLVIVISGYQNAERKYLCSLILALGASFQDVLSRKAIKNKNVQACTHLLSQDAEGKKYEAAVSWGLVIVSREWLYHCAVTGQRLDVQLYHPADKQNIPDLKSYSKESEKRNESGSDNTSSTSSQTGERKRIRYSDKDAKGCEVLEGCVVSVCDKKSDEGRLSILASCLGAKYQMNYDSRVTHLLYQGKLNASRIAKAASNDGKHIVHPEWLNACSSQQIKVPEDDYPSTYNPRKASLLVTPSKSTAGRQTSSMLNDTSQDESLTKLRELLENAKRQSCASRQVAAKSDILKASNMSRKDIEAAPENQICKVDVRWDNDFGRAERRKIAAQLAETQHVIQDGAFHGPIILLTKVEDEEKESLIRVSECLGGSVLDTAHFDSRATHLVCRGLNRNEKTLCSIASAIWIVSPSFIQDGAVNRKFPKEEDYEFEETKCENVVERDLLLAYRKWRSMMMSGKPRAFTNLRAVFYQTDGRQASMERLLVAGGGTVVQHQNLSDANIAVIDPSAIDNLKDVVAEARAAGVKCVKFNILYDMLIKESVNIDDYLIYAC